MSELLFHIEGNPNLIFHMRPSWRTCIHPLQHSSHSSYPTTSQLFQRWFGLLTDGKCLFYVSWKHPHPLRVKLASHNVRCCRNAEQEVVLAMKAQGSPHPWRFGSRLFGRTSHVSCSHRNQFNRRREKCKVSCSGCLSPLPCVRASDVCSFKFWLGEVLTPFVTNTYVCFSLDEMLLF